MVIFLLHPRQGRTPAMEGGEPQTINHAQHGREQEKIKASRQNKPPSTKASDQVSENQTSKSRTNQVRTFAIKEASKQDSK